MKLFVAAEREEGEMEREREIELFVEFTREIEWLTKGNSQTRFFATDFVARGTRVRGAKSISRFAATLSAEDLLVHSGDTRTKVSFYVLPGDRTEI